MAYADLRHFLKTAEAYGEVKHFSGMDWNLEMGSIAMPDNIWKFKP